MVHIMGGVAYGDDDARLDPKSGEEEQTRYPDNLTPTERFVEGLADAPDEEPETTEGEPDPEPEPEPEPEPDPVEIVLQERPAPVTVRLDFPFTADGELIREIDIFPPSMNAARRLANGSEAEVYAEMTGLSVAILDALRHSDAVRFYKAADAVVPEVG